MKSAPAVGELSLRERALSAVVIGVLIRVAHTLFLRDTFPQHDTRQAYEMFHAFLNALVNYHEIPMWFSQVRYGVSSEIQILLTMSAPKLLAAFGAALTGQTNTLRIFYLALGIESFVFCYGAYLLGRSLFVTRAAAIFLTASCFFTTFYLWQMWFDFQAIVWLPLVLYFLRRFAFGADLRALTAALVCLLMSQMGNITYLAAIYLFFLVWGLTLALHEASVFSRVRPFVAEVISTAKVHRAGNLALGALLAASTACYLSIGLRIMDHLQLASPGRSPEGVVPLDDFLSYGYDRSFDRLYEAIAAVPSSMDARFFLGCCNLIFLFFALLTVRRRPLAILAVGAFVFLALAFADATIVPMLFYRLVPGANRVRHIGLLLPFCRFLIFCIAAMGFDALYTNLRAGGENVTKQVRVLVGVILVTLLFAALINKRPHYGAAWKGGFTTAEGLHWISFGAGVTVLLAVLRFRWTTPVSPPVWTAAIIILAHSVELNSYQFFLYRSPAIKVPSDSSRPTEAKGFRGNLWRSPPPVQLAQIDWGMAGTRYGTRDVFLNTSWCAIKSRTDYVNRYVARMGFSELVDVTRASNRRLLGCAEGTRDGVIESYSSDASRPEPVVFHFDPAVAAQGIEILPELDDAERAPTTFEVSGSNDNVNWTAVFSEKTAREPLRAGEAIASWFGNTTPYSWYRVDLTGNGTSASIAASAIRLRTELPEARTVSDVILMDAEEEALARLAEFEAFEGADAIRERPTIIQPTGPIAQPGPGQAAGAPIDSVTLLRQTYNVVDLVVGAGQGGRWLTYADGWHPAWIAHVDGQPQPVARANVGFKAVWVEPGIHRVTLEFENRAFFWKYCALAALMMGAFIWGLAYFVGARRAL